MASLVDTHTLIWFLTKDKRLGRKAIEVLRKAESGDGTVIIPTIVLAEIMYICGKNKAELSFNKVLEKLIGSVNYLVCDLDIDTIIKASELDKIMEIHDRIIVASALLTGSKILTKDENIKESNYVEAVW